MAEVAVLGALAVAAAALDAVLGGRSWDAPLREAARLRRPARRTTVRSRRAADAGRRGGAAGRGGRPRRRWCRWAAASRPGCR
ncbi:hypothetical protein [Actinomadura sp. CNU-125]|uniref:hypothetical protein n=1 Tax=Actinomadura sp. CNU-125 TaxID=1904961 RepID=UPI001178B129|nr:hypothetical protein [Actinomadura sp. CNU-125]